MYKQNVGTEDVFLGLSDVDPSSSSCNYMVVKVQLPKQKLADIELDVQKQRIRVSAPDLYVCCRHVAGACTCIHLLPMNHYSRVKCLVHSLLSTYLPHMCRSKDGKAKWVSDKETLVVTLPIIRAEW